MHLTNHVKQRVFNTHGYTGYLPFSNQFVCGYVWASGSKTGSARNRL